MSIANKIRLLALFTFVFVIVARFLAFGYMTLIFGWAIALALIFYLVFMFITASKSKKYKNPSIAMAIISSAIIIFSMAFMPDSHDSGSFNLFGEVDRSSGSSSFAMIVIYFIGVFISFVSMFTVKPKKSVED
jgi:hypothetical protein